MRIAVDAMGTDDRPKPDVAGAILAANERDISIVLVGDEKLLELEILNYPTGGLDISIKHASQDIAMHEKPTVAAKTKKDSSMHVGLSLVRDGDADAFVSAGHTGALLTISTLYTVKRLSGVRRPAITAIIPTLTGPVVASDVGANSDCKPEFLVQFALMASIYAKISNHVENPRVALLSNGEEEGKGNALIKETALLLKGIDSLNFIGNVEPKEVFNGGTDVVIHDGFTGNVFIKTAEASMRAMRTLINEEIRADIPSMAGGLLSKKAFKRVGERMSDEAIGGAPLLGLNGVVISAHGRSNEIAMKNAIFRAYDAVQGKLIEGISEQLDS